ncbi:hypothetical protein RN001_014724 [Aquatica leii]|uniref:Glycosyltransferase-like protein LARGE2 n=1 Tax=Aquatica leii TaxID=1421715 RepID=A0AAN7NUU7_9COLE|nr:hypothetical protein RN001_014724 [Aquatica leii]
MCQTLLLAAGVAALIDSMQMVGVPRTTVKFSQSHVSYLFDAPCEVVHVSSICLSDSCDRVNFYTLLKSIFSYRNHPLEFHLLVDDLTEKFAEVLLSTWSVSQVNLHTYNIRDLPIEFRQAATKNHDLLIMSLPEVISSYATKVILVNPDIFIEGDVYSIWKVFDKFRKNQAIGLVKHNDYSVVLIDVEEMRKTKSPSIADYTNKILWLLSLNNDDPCLFLNVSLTHVKWNRINDIKLGVNTSVTLETLNAVSSVMDALPPKLPKCGGVFPEVYLEGDEVPQCRQYPERNYKRKTLLYARSFKYTPKKHDITMMTHLTYQKMTLFEEIGSRWKGPISAAIYLAEDELEKCLDFIEKSKTLRKRYDIAYHVVFKMGRFYPVNVMRNVALRNVLTEYVFLVDVDFLPMENLQDHIKQNIKNMKTMDKKALVVPAFSSYNPRAMIPRTLEEWMRQWDTQRIFQFQHIVFPVGHRPTNYTRLRNATEPYVIKWAPKYEPYVVVQTNVTEYDERFFAYGQNKIAHILTLVAQQYEFIVLPNTFLIHKFHKPFGDLNYFKIKSYMFCLDTLIYEHTKQLNDKYGTNFNFEDFLF